MYQLITQVIGRVGRGHIDGHAVIQTYQPDNPILISAVNKDWAAFYKQEIAERQQFTFPPFCFLLKLTCKRASRESAETTAANLVNSLKASRLKLIVSDATPSFHEKVGSKYEWQIIVRAKDRDRLLKAIEQLPSGWSYDIDPINLL
jgi:primosomal protein N' (replication factor Y)